MADLENHPKQQRMTKMESNIEPHKQFAGAWTVETIDDDGGIEQAIFDGPNAEERARAYRDFIDRG